LSKVREYIALNGDWEFAYSKEVPDMQHIEFPKKEDYQVKMPVPGYWDDNVDRLRYANFWSRDCNFNPEYRGISSLPMGAGKPADASLPFLLGTGWYKRKFIAGWDLEQHSVTLNVGGVALEAWVWLNGKFVGYHLGHLTPFQVDLSKSIRPGEQNELIIAVANTRTDRIGCSIRGYKGKSAGITRSVYIQITGESRISDCYVCTNPQLNQLLWQVEIKGKTDKKQMFIDWEILNPLTEERVAQGSVEAKEPITSWSTESFGLEAWCDVNPKLYKLKMVLRQGDYVLDEQEQSYGLRYLEAQGNKILLNGEAVILRGLTDHAYFPETCTVPTTLSFYMDTLKVLKGLGFNWVRFHTWIPPEECLIAADKLGMMLQVETPNGFKECDWLDALRTCRKHPSVVIYCTSNEVALTDSMLDYLEIMAQHCKHIVPDALFNPMEGLRGVEYEFDEADPGFVKEPYPHNESKLKRLKSYSDVFAPHGSIFSYHSLNTDDSVMENRLSIYEKPCLMHEIGINDSYLNLDLEHRYVGTRIGTDLFSATRAYLKEMGVLHKAPLYYQNSCRWMHQIVKYSIENARRCEYVTGYDLLGAIDCHWHRSGYAVGLLNEFYELKAGISAEAVQRYNGRSMLLAEVGTKRNLKAGQILSLRMLASLYGSNSMDQGRLSWQLMDDEQTVYVRGEKEVQKSFKGCVTELGTIQLEIPSVGSVAKHVKLQARLTGGEYELVNSWDYWVFPEVKSEELSIRGHEVKVLEKLDREALDYINDGGRVILLGNQPFPSLKTTYQIMSGGRTQGNNATVVHNHPLMEVFPNEGYCDWQFYSMIEGASTVVFNDLDIPFQPIVEMVSSYKMVRKQASLFELRIGKGGLLVCTLKLHPSDPGACYLKNRMMRYMISDSFVPNITVKPEVISGLLHSSKELNVDFSTDEGYDNGGHVHN
jgi:beta-galactosidase